MQHDSFLFKKEWRDAICELPEKVRAEVYAAIIEYGIAGEAPQLKSMARMAFAFVKSDIDRERARETRQATVSEEMRRRVMKRWNKDGAGTDVNTQVNTDVYTDVNTQVNTQVNTDVYTQVDTDVYTQKTPSPSRARNEEVRGIDNKEDNNINIKLNKEKERGREKESQPDKNASKLQKRKQAFYQSLVPFVGRYGSDTIRAFYDYWTEPNKSRTRMRFELQPTWDLARRIARWAAKDNAFRAATGGGDAQRLREIAIQRERQDEQRQAQYEIDKRNAVSYDEYRRQKAAKAGKPP